MTQQVIPKPEMKEHNYLFLTVILFWSGIVVVSGVYLTIPLVSVFTQVFDSTPAQVAWTSSAFSLFYAFGCLFSSALSDQYGRKRVILCGLVALSVITGMLGLSNSLSTVIALRSIQGLVATTFAPVAMLYVVEMFPPEKRVTTIGCVTSGFLMSAIIGQVYSSLISDIFNWQSVFYILGGIYFITALIVGFFMPNQESQGSLRSLSEHIKPFKSVMTKKPLLLCYLIASCLLLTFVGMYTTLGSYLNIEFGLNHQQIFYVRVVGIFGMLFAPFTGKLVDKFGLKNSLSGGLALAFVGLAVLGMISYLPFMIFMSVLFVSGIAITIPTIISLVGQLGDQSRGAAVSLFTVIMFIGASLGPIVATALFQYTSYFLTFEMLALLLGMSLLISLFVNTKR